MTLYRRRLVCLLLVRGMQQGGPRGAARRAAGQAPAPAREPGQAEVTFRLQVWDFSLDAALAEHGAAAMTRVRQQKNVFYVYAYSSSRRMGCLPLLVLFFAVFFVFVFGVVCFGGGAVLRFYICTFVCVFFFFLWSVSSSKDVLIGCVYIILRIIRIPFLVVPVKAPCLPCVFCFRSVVCFADVGVFMSDVVFVFARGSAAAKGGGVWFV